MIDQNSKSAALPGSLRAANIKKIASILGPIISVVMLCLALWFLHRELAGLSRNAIVEHVQTIPLITFLASLAFAACSYFAMTGYDAAALRYLGKRMPYRRSALTAFMAYAVGHNVGLVTVSGGSIRYRMYTLSGLTASEIAVIILFVTVTFALGASVLLGLALISAPVTETEFPGVPPALLTTIGVLLLLVSIAYIAAPYLYRRPITFRNWRFSLPRPGIAISQLGLSVADLIFGAASLYVLLAPSLPIAFFPFLGIYLLAMFAGLISSVPGGIGVFEAVLVVAFPQAEPAALFGTVLVYRLIYYVLPLSVALVLLVAHEMRQHRNAFVQSTATVRHRLSGIAPQVLAIAVFLGGVVLLVSGASPAIESRLTLIAKGIPLPVLELSHLAGSVTGVGLLILARGLYRRLHGAYLAALIGLTVGIGMSLLKGLDYEEATILGAVAIALWSSRDEFYRQGSLAAQRFSVQWIAAIIFVLCVATWVGFVSYRHVEYSDQLWWQFAFDAEAPRMLRASVSTAVVAMGFALWKVLQSTSKEPLSVNAPDSDKDLRHVLEATSDASSNLALLGDKQFLWSADHQGFIMYQISGDSWIAMGDPVGPEDYHEELAWAFLELVDRFDGRVVFYQVSDKSLSLYVDLGLSLAKLGEDARVPLSAFSLEGSRRAHLRHAVNRAKKDGAEFDLVSRIDLPAIIPDLRRVSDSWLADKSTREKSFSLGSFSESYIANFDCAVVRINNKIVAFANLWAAPASSELSVDLMRYDRNACKGVMDYLFVEILLWAAANEYKAFSLGMAPLSGLEQRALAPLWHKLGNLIFTHGESFYNFEGLRRYKEKFDPEWAPRYIAFPAGWVSLPAALLDVSRLISGGLTRILIK